MKTHLLVGASLIAMAATSAAFADDMVVVEPQATFNFGYSTSWLAQIGVTPTIETQANGGQGAVIGFIDTGVVSTQADIAGRVSPLSSCAAVTFRCSKGYQDDNGHGTATAAIGAGSVYGTNSGMSGVAPKATIVEEKVLNANGSGYDVDVANGIKKAADAGAQVISLSLTYIPTSAVINAINYATSKGAIIVYAAGNSALPLNNGANTTGLTAASLSRMVFVGSVDSQNQMSSFSNTPGTGSAVAGSTSVPYAQLFVDAPGENIIAPCVAKCYSQLHSTFAYWTGTSMSTPEVAGALALLETTWPILRTNGTATSLLFQTATDLGAAGVDNTYGWGLLNVSAAFNAVGTLSITTSGGGSTPVTHLTSTSVTGGAMGTMNGIKPFLSNYTAFDAFQRNFSVDLSGLVNESVSHAASLLSALTPTVLNGSERLANGGEMALTMAADNYLPRSTVPGADGLRESNAGVPLYGAATGQWMMTLTNAGSEVSVGHGFPASMSFAEALWGRGTAGADASYAMQGTTDLLNIAEGGHFMSLGMDVGEKTRMGFAMSNAGMPDYSVAAAGRLMPKASGVSVGLTTEFTKGWSGGFTVSALTEQNGLLGAIYTPGGAFGLGAEHKSASIALSTSFDLGKKTGLLFNAAIARSDGVALNGIFSGVSPMLARSYGAALVERDVFMNDDHLSASVTKPLRVFDGSLGIAMTGVDADGLPHTSITRVAIRPDGDETDFGLGYAKFWQGANLTASLNYRQDAENMRGLTDMVARMGVGFRF